MIRTLLRPFLGKKAFQRLFKVMHMMALEGMNYGMGGDPKESGEAQVFFLLKKWSGAKKLTIFDVGANTGQYSMELQKYLKGVELSLHVFEPSKASFDQLKNNVAAENAILNNFGLGKEKAMLTLFKDKEGSGWASVYNRQLEGVKFDVTEQIEIRTLDEYCELNSIKEIDFLKLDVEGHELAVLEGGKTMLESQKIKLIQFEFGGCNLDSRTSFRDFYFLLSEKYNIYRIVQNGFVKIDRYSEVLEIYSNINYLAVRNDLPV